MPNTTPPSVRLGAIAFINTLPVYYGLQAEGVTLHYDHPAALNRMMSEGKLDVSPVSSAYYLQHQNGLVLLDDLSVSSPGAVESVLFISKRPLSESAQFEKIMIPDDSATSVQLLRWILQHETGEDLADRFGIYPASHVQQVLAETGCALVIGDNALLLHEGELPGGYQIYDLSSLWKARTGLPFVFAVWVANRGWAEKNPDALATVNRALTQNRDRFFNNADLMQQGIAEATSRCRIAEESIRRYYTRCLQYTLADEHRQALALFAEILSTSQADSQDVSRREPQLTR